MSKIKQLIDYSQSVARIGFGFGADFEKGSRTPREKQESIMRHCLLNDVLEWKRKFGEESDVVFALDGQKYWRKDLFPYYKHSRKAAKSTATLDWDSVYQIADKLHGELKQVFPFKWVKCDKIEADDIAGVMCKWWQTNELVGAFDPSPPKIVLISSDGDWSQMMLKYKNIAQWNPILKKVVPRPEKYSLLEKILKGDSGDGIPSILSPDDFFLNDTPRQKPITAKFKQSIIEHYEKTGEVLFDDPGVSERYLRNKRLIDFEEIPENISSTIISEYNKQIPVYDKTAILNYFIANRCKNLMDSINDF
jgi:T4 RNase H, C terminal/5'-3' exonuclease, N-terminal resolvase-like domain